MPPQHPLLVARPLRPPQARPLLHLPRRPLPSQPPRSNSPSPCRDENAYNLPTEGGFDDDGRSRLFCFLMLGEFGRCAYDSNMAARDSKSNSPKTASLARLLTKTLYRFPIPSVMSSGFLRLRSAHRRSPNLLTGAKVPVWSSAISLDQCQ